MRVLVKAKGWGQPSVMDRALALGLQVQRFESHVVKVNSLLNPHVFFSVLHCKLFLCQLLEEACDFSSGLRFYQALLSHFSLLADFLIRKLLVKGRDSRFLKLVNLNPVTQRDGQNLNK
jgi:hypothetical protein